MTRRTTSALVAALCLLVAAPALATQTRINSLSGNEKAFTVRDQANIYHLPQFLVDYGNQVDVDATAGGVYGRMNVRYSLTDDAVLLLYGIRSPWVPVVNAPTLGGVDAKGGAVPGVTAMGVSGMNTASYGGLNLDPTNHQFGLGFGMRVGEASRLGALFSIGGKNRTRDANLENHNTWINFVLGFGFDIGETDSLDLGLTLGLGMFTNVESAERYTADGLLNFGLMAKGEFSVHQIASIVPYLTLNFDSRGVFHQANNACAPADPNDVQACAALKGTTSVNDVRVGADLAIKPAEGVLVQPGLGLRFQSGFSEGNTVKQANAPLGTMEESQILTPYYGFGAEAAVFDWMVLRLAARQHIVRHDNASTIQNPPGTLPAAIQSNERHWSDVANVVTTGLGIQLRGWTIDLNVTPTFWNNGVFAINGAATTPFAIDFAMVYDW